MGTRGLYGFRKNGVDKLTYNHFDSYPSGLGVEVVTFIKDTKNELLNDIFDKIILVNEEDDISADILNYYKNEFSDDISDMSWYGLQQTFISELGLLTCYTHNINHMVDNHNFIEDSLFCEWAYIINLDTNTLEVYKGFQREPQKNRYFTDISSNQFFNCALIREYKLDTVTEQDLKNLEEEFNN